LEVDECGVAEDLGEEMLLLVVCEEVDHLGASAVVVYVPLVVSV
jgi:hypothetical protein